VGACVRAGTPGRTQASQSVAASAACALHLKCPRHTLRAAHELTPAAHTARPWCTPPPARSMFQKRYVSFPNSPPPSLASSMPGYLLPICRSGFTMRRSRPPPPVASGTGIRACTRANAEAPALSPPLRSLPETGEESKGGLQRRACGCLRQQPLRTSLPLFDARTPMKVEEKLSKSSVKGTAPWPSSSQWNGRNTSPAFVRNEGHGTIP